MEFWDQIADGITVFLIFLGFSSPVLIFFAFLYFKKRLEHKQIMAAIEKGVPCPQIKLPAKTEPKWIKNITRGIVLVIFGVGFICLTSVFYTRFDPLTSWAIGLILFAIGVSNIIRGILRKGIEQAEKNASPEGQDTNPAV